MAAKVMVKELQLMASDPKSTVLMLLLPFLFRLPGKLLSIEIFATSQSRYMPDDLPSMN